MDDVVQEGQNKSFGFLTRRICPLYFINLEARIAENKYQQQSVDIHI
jgi:hypothetical protein